MTFKDCHCFQKLASMMAFPYTTTTKLRWGWWQWRKKKTPQGAKELITDYLTNAKQHLPPYDRQKAEHEIQSSGISSHPKNQSDKD